MIAIKLRLVPPAALRDKVDIAVDVAARMALTEVLQNEVVPQARAAAGSFARSSNFQNSIHAGEVESDGAGMFFISLVANPKNEEGRGYGRAVEKGTGEYVGRGPIVIEPREARDEEGEGGILAFDNGGFATRAIVHGMEGKHVLANALRAAKPQLRAAVKQAIARQMRG